MVGKNSKKVNDKQKKTKSNLCKVVIYNYVFVGFNSEPNVILILFNLMYPVFHVSFICKGCVWKRECMKTQDKLKTEVFLLVARE